MSANITAETRRKFDRLIDAEIEVKSMRVVLACSTTGKSAYAVGREAASAKAAQDRFDKAFAALSVDEAREFGAYRRTVLGL